MILKYLIIFSIVPAILLLIYSAIVASNAGADEDCDVSLDNIGAISVVVCLIVIFKSAFLTKILAP
jgi:hypothetical protein